MLKKDVYPFCEYWGGKYGFDPYLILAIVEQESSYRTDAVRLENGFFRKYAEPLHEATTNEVLYSVSYGLMQVLGMSLKEMGYFDYFRETYNNLHSFQLVSSSSEIAVAKGVNEFMVRPEWQIQWGVAWLDVKRKIAGGDTRKTLLFWNGGGNPLYPDQVLKKMKSLKGSTL